MACPVVATATIRPRVVLEIGVRDVEDASIATWLHRRPFRFGNSDLRNLTSARAAALSCLLVYSG